jgi:ADP-ribose pyrophosphatase YjhB (NUDIX family)
VNYCSHCGTRLFHEIPPGDDRQRDVCHHCGLIHYQNPKLVVGCIPEWEGQILLCRRAIEPYVGKWTLPAGYLENGETVAEGAIREVHEEAGAQVSHLIPYALYNLSFISQIYLLFRARLAEQHWSAGSESLEVRLFDETDIPWEQIAFTVIYKTLQRYFADRRRGQFPFFIGDIDKHRGAIGNHKGR